MTDRLMIVDDDLDTVPCSAIGARGDGSDHRRAQDGMEALLTLRQHAPDLILLDLEMPGPAGMTC